MKCLLLLAAQHAQVKDVFSELVPKWAFAALFARIMGSDDAEHMLLSSTALQDWLRSEQIMVPSRLVLEYFTSSMHTEVATKADFVAVRLAMMASACLSNRLHGFSLAAHCTHAPRTGWLALSGK